MDFVVQSLAALNSGAAAVVHGQGGWVLCTKTDASVMGLQTSPDAASWTPYPLLGSATADRALDAAFNATGRCVVVGTQGRAFYSDDLAAWAAVTSSFATTGITGVAHGNGLYVAVGGAKCGYSANGISWAQRAALPTTSAQQIAFGDGVYVAVGTSGWLGRSTDNGVSWTTIGAGFGTSTINNVAYDPDTGVWCAVGAGGKIATSVDGGLTWTQRTSGTTQILYAVACAGGTWLVGGAGGVVLESDDLAAWTVATTALGSNTVRGIGTDGSIFVVQTDFAQVAVSASPSIAISLPVEVNVVAPPVVAVGIEVTVASASIAASLPVTVNAVVPGAIALPLSVRVNDPDIYADLDGAATWAAAPHGRWRAIVVLGDQDISDRLIGEVSVEHEDNTAALADFEFLPAGLLQPASLIQRSVRISFAWDDGSNVQMLFAGVVAWPEPDATTGAVRCTCTNRAQEIWAAMPRAAIDALVGGRYHTAVSGERDDNYEYLVERIKSVGASWAVDALLQPRILTWQGAAKTFTVREADVIDGAFEVALPDGDQLRSRVTCRLQHRYQLLRGRRVVAQYAHDFALIRPRIYATTNYPGVTALTAAMVQQACEGVTGWTRVSEIDIEHPPSGAWMIGTSETQGVYSISPRVAQDLALGFKAEYAARWQQTVTETYEITLVWSALEAQLGSGASGAPEVEGATLEAKFDSPAWSSDATVLPDVTPPALGDRSVAHQPPGADAAARDEALRTLLDRAWVGMWSRSRSGRVRFAIPCRPDIWLDARITVEARRLRAAGKVADVTHRLDVATGAATSYLGIAVGMPGEASATLPVWTLPPAPAPAYVPPISSFSFEIGEYVGGGPESAEWDEATMIGFSTNLLGPSDDALNYYPHQLSIKAPDLAAEDRDPAELTAAATIPITIPTDLLEILP